MCQSCLQVIVIMKIIGGDDYGDGDDCVDLCSDDGDDAYMVKMMMMVMMTLMLVMMGICGPGKFSKSCVT